MSKIPKCFFRARFNLSSNGNKSCPAGALGLGCMGGRIGGLDAGVTAGIGGNFLHIGL